MAKMPAAEKALVFALIDERIETEKRQEKTMKSQQGAANRRVSMARRR